MQIDRDTLTKAINDLDMLRASIESYICARNYSPDIDVDHAWDAARDVRALMCDLSALSGSVVAPVRR